MCNTWSTDNSAHDLIEIEMIKMSDVCMINFNTDVSCLHPNLPGDHDSVQPDLCETVSELELYDHSQTFCCKLTYIET